MSLTVEGARATSDLAVFMDALEGKGRSGTSCPARRAAGEDDVIDATIEGYVRASAASRVRGDVSQDERREARP